MRGCRQTRGIGAQQARGIGRSNGALSSKSHAGVDALENPPCFEINAGQVHDSNDAIPALERLNAARNILADMAYDAGYIRSFIADDLKAIAVAAGHPSRAIAFPIGNEMYKGRHLIGCFLNKIERFRQIGLRCKKAISSFRAFAAIAC